jgi:hypothetical protein
VCKSAVGLGQKVAHEDEDHVVSHPFKPFEQLPQFPQHCKRYATGGVGCPRDESEEVVDVDFIEVHGLGMFVNAGFQ